MVKRIFLIGVVASIFSLNVQAEDIVEFGDPGLIDIFDSSSAKETTQDSFNLPTPPVKIQNVKGSRYAFKMDKKTYWVEGVDVETSGQVQIESLCNSTQLATDYETNHFGIRGAGIGCKK